MQCGRPTRSARWRSSAASLALAFAAFTLLYRVVPPVPVRILDVLPGAAVATLGVHLAGAGFSIYLDRFADFDDVYGPLGTVLAFLLLVWVTAAILLVGACLAAAWPLAALQPAEEEPGPHVPLSARLLAAARGLIFRDPKPK